MKKALIKRKGIFFTISSLFFALLLITLSSVFVQYRLSEQMNVVKARVNSMDTFLSSLEEDLERASYISGYRGLVALNNFITSNGTYLDDAATEFKQIVVNGTIGNEAEMEALMINQTLISWTSKAQNIGSRIGINTEVKFLSASVSQSDPWHIRIDASYNVTVWDNRNTAVMKKTVSASSFVPVDNLEDPVYRIETLAKVSRRISIYNYTVNSSSKLKEHLELGTYIANPDAPSYLMRMEGSFGSSPYGIETMVDKNELESLGLGVLNRTNVDYMYWGGSSGGLSKISGITDSGHPFFQLDDAHVALFNVSGDVY